MEKDTEPQSSIESSTTLPTYSYTNEQSVDMELKCPICYDPFLSPSVCKHCRNTFCRKCVESLTRCPVCRGVISLQEPPRLLSNLLGKLTVTCNVCTKEVKRADFDLHVTQDCPIKCNWGCDAMVTRASLVSHQDVCTYKSIQCQANDVGCNFTSPRMSMSDHELVCHYLALRQVLQAQQTKIQRLEKKVQQLQQNAASPQQQQQTIRLPLVLKFSSPRSVPPPSSTPRRRPRSPVSYEDESESSSTSDEDSPRITHHQRSKKRHKS